MKIAIENCKFQYQCDQRWEDLEATGDDGRVRFCRACRGRVYYCGDDDALTKHVDEDHCVAIKKVEESESDSDRKVWVVGMAAEKYRWPRLDKD